MKLGEIVEGFSIPPYPKGVSLEGKLVDLKPLNAMSMLKNSLEQIH